MRLPLKGTKLDIRLTTSDEVTEQDEMALEELKDILSSIAYTAIRNG